MLFIAGTKITSSNGTTAESTIQPTDVIERSPIRRVRDGADAGTKDE